MPCEIVRKVIGDREWSTMQLSATRALTLESKLIPVFTQAIAPILGSLGQDDEAQGEAISRAFSAMAKAIPPEQFVALIRELCSEASVGGKRVDFETEFSGGRGVMLRYQVAWFVLEANFADFFGALLPEGVVVRARAAMEKRVAGAAA